MEKGEEFFKNKNKDLEKIRQFEENNFLKCSMKDYSKVFSRKKTKDFCSKISSSFYQNIENPVSSRSDGKGLISYYNLAKRNNNSSTNNDLLLSINNKNSEIEYFKEKINSGHSLECKNIKNENFTLKSENEVSLTKEKTLRKISLFNEELGIEVGKNAMNHRKTKSLELENKEFSFIKLKSFDSVKSNTKSDKTENIEMQKMKKKFSKKIKNCKFISKNENEIIKMNDLRDKINKASHLETSNFIIKKINS